MKLNVLIAPDKFKGTLSARAAADAMARGWRQARSSDQVVLFPISDGGDGFGDLVGASLGAESETVRTVDAAHQPCEAQWWWDPKSRTAILEAAQVNGLARLTADSAHLRFWQDDREGVPSPREAGRGIGRGVRDSASSPRPSPPQVGGGEGEGQSLQKLRCAPLGRHHPFDLDTYGLGAVVTAAHQMGACHCLIGIGGSATNDGGFGMARSLGWTFFDERGAMIQRWTELHSLSRCQPPQTVAWPEEMLVAVDVRNPLLGPSGCSRVYGPQKGLREEDFDLAERCLGRLAEVMEGQLHRRTADEPGAGAAGGLGFGLRSFLGARLAPGFDLFADHTGLKKRLSGADLVVTGEGAIDSSTFMGKGVGELAALCRGAKIPCLCLGGAVADHADAAQFFTRAYALTPDLTNRETALANAGEWLARLAAHAAESWQDS
jgi:glycerate kinase